MSEPIKFKAYPGPGKPIWYCDTYPPAGIYLTRGDGVAVPVTAEMLAAWVAFDPAKPTSHDEWIANDILVNALKGGSDHG